MANIVYKLFRRFLYYIYNKFSNLYLWCLFKLNNVEFLNFTSTGVPFVMVARGGKFSIGLNFRLHNGINGNPIGCYDNCTFFVNKEGRLKIGNDVGISQSALICHHSIIIGNNVKIGGGVKIYDTDFHSLDASIRNTNMDFNYKRNAPVYIDDNVFIGAYSIILKGVIIGKNSIIGAGSVVSKSVPQNQIWGGNPAKFIRNIE